MSKNTELTQAWGDFIQKWLGNANQGQYPQVTPDPDWPSPCEFIIGADTFWKPVLQSEHNSEDNTFENVGEAMGLAINEQYSNYFTLYFSEALEANHEKGPLTFLQAWSQEDFERLQQNLIGHLMMKKKLKQSPTLFFAVTDEDDLNIVVDNDTGQVCLEYVGKEPHEVIAKDLAEFIGACTAIF
jgi:SecY interacting protein Syd